MTHEAFIQAYLAAIETNELLGHEDEWYTPDAVQVEFPNRLTPQGATRAVADLQAAAARGAKIVERQSYEIVNCIEAGNQVAVEVIFRGTYTVDVLGLRAGETMTAHFAMFFQMRDGKIARQHNYDCFEPW